MSKIERENKKQIQQAAERVEGSFNNALISALMILVAVAILVKFGALFHFGI